MKIVRLFLLLIYVGYLVDAGLLMIILPWNPLWAVIVSALPPWAMPVFDAPAVRGAISAFGALHLALVSFELFSPGIRARQAS